ncbi:MAG: DUF5690 family protein [Planctomycetaceae bacterium]|jgi:hypothetical protein|nr:DUF5690 family protein [Planctomycetaceae bacterium]
MRNIFCLDYSQTASPNGKGDNIRFIIYCMFASFITYMSMYAFRKPLSVGTFTNMSYCGIDYKIILIMSQVFGYMISKLIGINFVSQLKPCYRIKIILLFIGIAWLSLFCFAFIPRPYNILFIFINGLPLGMIWGIVFSFLEGRKCTELLGAGMTSSLIVASGITKGIGKFLIEQYQVSEFWMPFLVGLLFVPFLLFGVWLLSKIPSPTLEDIALRAERVPMTRADRKIFLCSFTAGLFLTVTVYTTLSLFRDFRDNFSVEIWEQLGYTQSSLLLATTEIPSALAILLLTTLMIQIKNNRIAFYGNILIVLSGSLLMVVVTILFVLGKLHPILWMILTGFCLYIAYTTYQIMFFERWIALFRCRCNVGFLICIADSMGYMGSIGILFYKNFFSHHLNQLSFLINLAYISSGIIILFSLISFGYFLYKEHESVTKPVNNILAPNKSTEILQKLT